MLRRIVFLLGVAGATMMGAASGPGTPEPPVPRAASPSTGCTDTPAEVTTLRSSAARAGEGVWAAAGGRLVGLGSGVPIAVDTPAGTVVRHVVSREGVGTAFVRDGAGTDTVVLASASGTVRIRQRAEAVNPALSAGGDLAWSVGSQVRVRSAASGRIARYPVPGGGTAFSPIFAGGGLVVAVSAPPTAAVPEDERLNDLWRLTSEGHWRRLTSFSAGPDRWTAVRTPIAAPGGGVDFVLIRGRGSATVPPRSWLMHLEAGRVHRLAPLDREMYLAGRDGPARLWNVPDAAAARVDLVRETADGGTVVIGCGATLMDPLDVPDPDRGEAGSEREQEAEAPHAATGGAAPQIAVGILVGDFATPEAATTAATTIRGAGGVAATARVVDAAAVPNALRPGAFAVLVPLAPEADLGSALAAFRAALPAYASTSWVVTA